MKKSKLTVDLLCAEAKQFSVSESKHNEPSLFGVTDGKAVGTYLEHKFRSRLDEKYQFASGSSAKGIDLPELKVDLKVTSIRQPQSSCPFKNARQKIYGLGYSILLFVYDKTDDAKLKTANLDIKHTVFIEKHRTADFQITRSLLEVIDNEGNIDDVLAILYDKHLPIDEIAAQALAREILDNHPPQGYLTISNALQWRLQYRRVVDCAGSVDGVVRVSSDSE